MTYIITSQCIKCHRCESICPTGAVTQNEQQYQINSERCNNCVGHYTVPQCWAACPTNAGCVSAKTSPSELPEILSDNYWSDWFTLYDRLVSQLKANQQPDYWQRWFDRYSQALTKHLQTPASVGVNA